MRRFGPILAFCLLLAPARADDWPMYLGNLSHTSYASHETQLSTLTVPQLQQLWRTNVGATIASGVTVSKGFLFVGAWDGNFYSLNSVTGGIAWSRFLGKAPPPTDPVCQPGIGVTSQSVVSGDTVYVAGGDSAVYSLNRSTGEIRWRVQLADPNAGAYLWSSVMLSRNALYIGIASLGDCPLVRGGLARISLDDPTHPLIRYLIPENSQGATVWSTPAIDEQANLVYVTTGNASGQDAEGGVWGSTLLALDAATLEIKAHFFLPVLGTEDDADWGSSPTLFQASDGQQYVAANGKNGMMYVLHRPDLTLAWSYRLSKDCDSPEDGCGSVSTPAFDGQTLFTGAGQPGATNVPPGSVYAFDVLTQSLLWSYPARGTVLGPVTLAPGVVIVPTTRGVVILDASNGVELWSDSLGKTVVSQTVVSNGVLYATNVNGDVVAWGLPANGDSTNVVASPSGLTFLYTTGGPQPAPQAIKVFSSAAAVNFTVSSDSTWLVADLQSGVTPASISVQANTFGMAPGNYAGTLTIAPEGSNPITVSVNLLLNGPLPSLTSANVLNSASFQSGPLAPGSLFSIIARNLAGDTVGFAGGSWPTSLRGVSVKINGTPAPLSYVGPTQINAQMPVETPAGPTILTVESNGAVSEPVPLNIAPAAPGIFLTDGSHAAALNPDNTVNTAGNPAPTGGVIAVYFTGQGQVDNPVNTGDPASSDTLSNTVAPTTAMIGGLPATVEFSGLAPGFVGLAQANLRIPDLDSGDYPVTLNVGGVSSNAGIISVTRSQ